LFSQISRGGWLQAMALSYREPTKPRPRLRASELNEPARRHHLSARPTQGLDSHKLANWGRKLWGVGELMTALGLSAARLRLAHSRRGVGLWRGIHNWSTTSQKSDDAALRNRRAGLDPPPPIRDPTSGIPCCLLQGRTTTAVVYPSPGAKAAELIRRGLRFDNIDHGTVIMIRTEIHGPWHDNHRG